MYGGIVKADPSKGGRNQSYFDGPVGEVHRHRVRVKECKYETRYDGDDFFIAECEVVTSTQFKPGEVRSFVRNVTNRKGNSGGNEALAFMMHASGIDPTSAEAVQMSESERLEMVTLIVGKDTQAIAGAELNLQTVTRPQKKDSTKLWTDHIWSPAE